MLVLLSPRAQPFDKVSLCPAGPAETASQEEPGAIELLEALPDYE